MKTPRRHKVQSWKGLVAEVWNYWGVKLPWQPCCCFSISWQAAQLASYLPVQCLLPCFSVHTIFCRVWPSLCRGCYFMEYSYNCLGCFVCMIVWLCFLDQSFKALVVQFCSPGGREQKVQQANIHTLICPKMSNCSPAAVIIRSQSQGG